MKRIHRLDVVEVIILVKKCARSGALATMRKSDFPLPVAADGLYKVYNWDEVADYLGFDANELQMMWREARTHAVA